MAYDWSAKIKKAEKAEIMRFKNPFKMIPQLKKGSLRSKKYQKRSKSKIVMVKKV